MSYEEFADEYERLLKIFLSYPPNQVEQRVYLGKLADLCDANPGFEERYDEEQDQS